MPLQFRRVPPHTAITIDAPARLHLGFLDPNASLGRAFGSLGLAIDAHGTRVEARLAEHQQINGAIGDAERERIAHCLAQLQAAYGPATLAIDVRHAPRAHTGLGSGTQLALAVGTAFTQLVGQPASTVEIASLLGRGARSGIGILGFESGGLLLDGGPASGLHRGVPPLLARQPFPDEWRVLLVSDHSREGLHGVEERRALASLAPFPQSLAAHLCHLVLMQILPGVAERNFAPFALALTGMQQTIGEYFASAQGGVFASPEVELVLRAVAAERMAGIGQTSWGPTGFAILASTHDANGALATARHIARALPHIECTVVAGRNSGAAIRNSAAHTRRIDAA
ncbi:beta-RFAP synthase [Paraburkholderia fungorum]|uniref:Beta-RFAP synthase n=1 Tax=Paraburkholderia fungorum TaxID=134537 RepID=A0A1H1JCT7_9BURK|nr:beta-ribofuranosylaminobenzene 5'-phosphate synthase family protein [Paraburkholderia fungorum]SDR47789.1 beta-RFAP synthase [Paraburkholderia fungorum]